MIYHTVCINELRSHGPYRGIYFLTGNERWVGSIGVGIAGGAASEVRRVRGHHARDPERDGRLLLVAAPRLLGQLRSGHQILRGSFQEGLFFRLVWIRTEPKFTFRVFF